MGRNSGSVTEAGVTGFGVRREKAALSSGCEAHPANRSSRKQPEHHGGNPRRYPGSPVLRTPPPPRAARPGPRGRPVEFPRLATRGFPCCVGSPCAGMPPPIPRWNPGSVSRREGNPSVSRDDGLPRIATGSASTSPCFGACMAFTCVAACLLAEPPEAARCLEGFDGFVTSAAAPIATGWSDQLSGQELHLLKVRAFSRRTATGRLIRDFCAAQAVAQTAPQP